MKNSLKPSEGSVIDLKRSVDLKFILILFIYAIFFLFPIWNQAPADSSASAIERSMLFKAQTELLDGEGPLFWSTLESYFNVSPVDSVYQDSAFRMIDLARNKKLVPPPLHFPEGILEIYFILTKIKNENKKLQFQATIMVHTHSTAQVQDLNFSARTSRYQLNRQRGYWNESHPHEDLIIYHLSSPLQDNTLTPGIYDLQIQLQKEVFKTAVILDHRITPTTLAEISFESGSSRQKSVDSDLLKFQWKDYHSEEFVSSDNQWIQLNALDSQLQKPIASKTFHPPLPQNYEMKVPAPFLSGMVQASFYEERFYGRIHLLREARTLLPFVLPSKK